MTFCFVYMTAPNEAEAEDLGRKLVEARLVGCVNIIPKMKSIYNWNGKISESNEVIIIAKTETRLYSKVQEFIEKHHSYEIPCILQIPIKEGAAPYLDWLRSSMD